MSAVQAITGGLTQQATFLVLSLTSAPNAASTVKDTLGGISDMAKNIVIRAPAGGFSVTVGIGSEVWDDVTSLPRPSELRPFKEFKGDKHSALRTPGDLLFHIRADRKDLIFEFEHQLMLLLGDAVKVEDHVSGFRYFDARDLLGFVDGTANPVGASVPEAALLTASDGEHGVGGSYVVIQKYLHDMKGWKGLKTEQQEAIIGRTKLDNVETPDQPPEAQKPHKQLTTVTDSEGNEHDILRDNMPFGSPASNEYGTYFIGYSRKLWVTEKMLERMFVGEPAGKHDRLLDFSKAVTGCTFFVPCADDLDSLGD